MDVQQENAQVNKPVKPKVKRAVPEKAPTVINNNNIEKNMVVHK